MKTVEIKFSPIEFTTKSHYVKCDGGCEILEVCRVVDGPNKSFEVSVWQTMGSHRPLCWRERIRWCWNIIKTGNPWSDMVIINDDKAKELANFITTQIKQKKSK